MSAKWRLVRLGLNVLTRTWTIMGTQLFPPMPSSRIFHPSSAFISVCINIWPIKTFVRQIRPHAIPIYSALWNQSTQWLSTADCTPETSQNWPIPSHGDTLGNESTKWSRAFAIIIMMTSSNGNICRVTGPLCGEFTGLRWIPHTKAGDAELWCFLRLITRLSKHSRGWSFETISRPLWRHCNYVIWGWDVCHWFRKFPGKNNCQHTSPLGHYAAITKKQRQFRYCDDLKMMFNCYSVRQTSLNSLIVLAVHIKPWNLSVMGSDNSLSLNLETVWSIKWSHLNFHCTNVPVDVVVSVTTDKLAPNGANLSADIVLTTNLLEVFCQISLSH